MKKSQTPKVTRKAASPNPPWWLSQCLENIQNLGGTVCPEESCEANPYVNRYAHAYCNCQPPYSNGCVPPNNPPPNCCAYTASSPVPVMSQNCFCCCGCFADSTPVAFDKDKYKSLVEFEVGDMIYVADDIKLSSWSQRRVMFSSGAGDLAAPSLMLKVTFGSPDKPDYLLVSRAQLFLIPGGKLKPAAALVPGQDSLVATDGTPRPVLALEVGMFNKGLHHIATSTSPATSPDGHLIVAKDIVAGDWSLQVALSTRSRSNLALAEGAEDMPEFGTKEYEEALTKKSSSKKVSSKQQLEITPFRVAVPGLPEAKASAAEFAPFALENKTVIPDNAYAFLTPEQAADVAAQSSASSPSSQAGKEIVQYLFKLFGAFYPTVNFFFDELNPTPNAYFLGDTGGSRLVITGGMARCPAVKYEGMALVIATMIGAIASGPPFNDQDLSCLGLASYSAVGSTIPHVWLGLQSVPIIEAGFSQIIELFDYVQTSHRGGGDTCMNASLECRVNSMIAAYNLAPLPECASGQPAAALEVTGAKGNFGVPNGNVVVSFNMSVDPTTASNPANYWLDPMSNPLSASVSPTDPTQVIVITYLKLKTKYQLTVTNVLSDQQQTLIPGENTATFNTRK